MAQSYEQPSWPAALWHVQVGPDRAARRAALDGCAQRPNVRRCPADFKLLSTFYVHSRTGYSPVTGPAYPLHQRMQRFQDTRRRERLRAVPRGCGPHLPRSAVDGLHAPPTRNCCLSRCEPSSRTLSPATARTIRQSSGESRRSRGNSTLAGSSCISMPKPRPATSCRWKGIRRNVGRNGGVRRQTTSVSPGCRLLRQRLSPGRLSLVPDRRRSGRGVQRKCTFERGSHADQVPFAIVLTTRRDDAPPTLRFLLATHRSARRSVRPVRATA
jgi:hypothetical protein